MIFIFWFIIFGSVYSIYAAFKTKKPATILITLLIAIPVLLGTILFKQKFQKQIRENVIKEAIQKNETRKSDTISNVSNKIESNPVQSTLSQPIITLSTSKSNQPFEPIKINGLCTIDLPDSMEIQGEEFVTRVKDMYEEAGVSNTASQTLTIQQKGLNAKEPKAFDTYARFTVTKTNLGEDSGLDLFHPFTLTEEDKSQIVNSVNNEVKSTAKLNAKMEIISPISINVIKVNEMYGARTEYTRRINNNPVVIVSKYIFFNKNELYTVDISYRLKDENLWKNTLNGMLNSLKFLN